MVLACGEKGFHQSFATHLEVCVMPLSRAVLQLFLTPLARFDDGAGRLRRQADVKPQCPTVLTRTHGVVLSVSVF